MDAACSWPSVPQPEVRREHLLSYSVENWADKILKVKWTQRLKKLDEFLARRLARGPEPPWRRASAASQSEKPPPPARKLLATQDKEGGNSAARRRRAKRVARCGAAPKAVASGESAPPHRRRRRRSKPIRPVHDADELARRMAAGLYTTVRELTRGRPTRTQL